MKHAVFQLACGLVLCVGATLPAQADTPVERVVCTQAPRAEWMSEAKIKAIFGEKNFTLVKLKVSRGNCYEFYAVHKDGSVVEAYYHPVTGESVRYNRVSIKPAEPGYETRSTAPAR